MVISGTYENEINNLNKSKQLKQITRENIRLDDKQINKELAEKMINPYYFIDRLLQVKFITTLESHHISHANFQLISKPNYLEFGIEVRINIKIIKDLSISYARLI